MCLNFIYLFIYTGWANFSFREANSILAVEVCLMIVLIFDMIGIFIHRNTKDEHLRVVIKFYYFSFIFLCLSLVCCTSLVLFQPSQRIIELSFLISMFALINLSFNSKSTKYKFLLF